MGKQYNKVEKRRRRRAYILRLKQNRCSQWRTARPRPAAE